MNVLSVIESTADGIVPQKAVHGSLAPGLLRKMHAYWRAANYISIGQVYLRDNSLLEVPLLTEHIKPGMLCQGSNTAALNFLYVHLNRLIKENDLSMILVTGVSHCAAGLVAQSYLEGSYTERFPSTSRNRDGLKALFNQHVQARRSYGLVPMRTQGIVRENGDAGNSLLHAYGSAFESPELIVACFIEDDQAELGTLAPGWHYNKFLDPLLDGAVLPILHLGGIDGASPFAPKRLSDDALIAVMRAGGYEPTLIECNDPARMHEALAEGLDTALASIAEIQSTARSAGFAKQIERPRWPMLIFHTPDDWNGPVFAEGSSNEFHKGMHWVSDTYFSSPRHVSQLEAWMKSYSPNELFDESGTFREELATLVPKGQQRVGFNVYVDDDVFSSQPSLPDLHRYAVMVKEPGDVVVEGRRVLNTCLDDIEALHRDANKSYCFVAEETLEMRLAAISSAFGGGRDGDDRHEATSSRSMAHVLSEHLLDEWLAGYKTTGSHELFSCYEAFIHAIDVLLKQHVGDTEEVDPVLLRTPTALLERVRARLSFQPIGGSIDDSIPATELFDRSPSEKAGCYAMKLSGVENNSCSCDRINDERHVFGEPVEQHRRTIAQFEEDESRNRQGVPHWHWTH